MCGQLASQAMMDGMCSINGLSEEDLLTNCDLLQASLYKILRSRADVIIRNIRAEILSARSVKFTIGDIFETCLFC